MSNISNIRCSKCRRNVLDESVISSSSVLSTRSSVVELNPDFDFESHSSGRWIRDAVEKSGWTKGKLHCPHCDTGIGSFDLVGSSTMMRLIGSRVDVMTSDLAENVQSITVNHQQQPVSTNSSSSSSSAETDFEGDRCSSTLVSSSSSTTISSLEDDGSSVGPNRIEEISKKKSKRKRQKRRKTFIDEILNGEPELDDVDDSWICPVCLDLLHQPFEVQPCKHSFCEPCLRRLGSKNPMNTQCPMCRTRIVICDPISELCQKIFESHHDLFLKRKKMERSSNVYSLPLPWKPGWKNLLTGRAMGGNRFGGEGHLNYFRRLLAQLPYYIPLINIMNLFIFVFVVGGLELASMFFGIVVGPPFKILHPSIGRQQLPSSDELSTDSELETFIPASSPVMDATFYYVLCTMSLVFAVFGNFILIQHQIGLLPQGTILDRIYNMFCQRFQRVSDFIVILGISSLPILLLPMITHVLQEEEKEEEQQLQPSSSTISSSSSTSFTSSSSSSSYVNTKILFQILEIFSSFMSIQTGITICLLYWMGTVLLQYDNDE